MKPIKADLWHLKLSLADPQSDNPDLNPGISFAALGIPLPNNYRYATFAQSASQTTGGLARVGYENASLNWGELTPAQASIIQNMILTAEITGGVGNGLVYGTLPFTEPNYDTRVWIDFSGLIHMPKWDELTNRGLIYTNVILNFNNTTRLREWMP